MGAHSDGDADRSSPAGSPRPRGLGWWRDADGLYYPPELHPDYESLQRNPTTKSDDVTLHRTTPEQQRTAGVGSEHVGTHHGPWFRVFSILLVLGGFAAFFGWATHEEPQVQTVPRAVHRPSDPKGVIAECQAEGAATSTTTPEQRIDGLVTTLAGTAGAPGWVNGTGPVAQFSQPASIAVDPSGDIYVGELVNQTIRKVTPDGEVTTIAGFPLVPGWNDAQGMQALFNSPAGLALDQSGNLFIADKWNHVIRKRSPDGNVTTIAGTPGREGSTDGQRGDARFLGPTGVAVDDKDDVYVADSGNDTIRRIAPDGRVDTIAGKAGKPGFVDGDGKDARFNTPSSLAVAPDGDVYVTDSGNGTIRKIGVHGGVTTVAGTAVPLGSPSWGVTPAADGTGTAARFRLPVAVSIDAEGNLYVADALDQTIKLVDAGCRVTTIAGDPDQSGLSDGTGPGARFDTPTGVASDSNGHLYVADSQNHTVRRIG